MELLERKQFLVELEAILKDLGVGGGRFVLISGEAGIGKTSLVERFAKEHEKGASVLWGACDALFTPRPLGPLYDIAHQTQGNLLELLEAEAPRASIFSAVLDELESSRGPVIAVIEDVHWADEATLDLLKFLGRRINRINLLLIVTYRDDEVGADQPLRRVLGDLPHLARLRLPPLSVAAVRKGSGHGLFITRRKPATARLRSNTRPSPPDKQPRLTRIVKRQLITKSHCGMQTELRRKS